ncbi:hypothetical protein B0H67DRAFT_673017 [Lasiosphaeris hirsuta]|uniref:Uncharacterized protein n=1 Tax=Lasiosphaeris hirsuta TaxID=260670 RepID=A0AA40A3R8_9PEZI|nr:hypothetical protein B0H67DRAFT_673017 [Lasiosphaeris hirsuta]
MKSVKTSDFVLLSEAPKFWVPDPEPRQADSLASIRLREPTPDSVTGRRVESLALIRLREPTPESVADTTFNVSPAASLSRSQSPRAPKRPLPGQEKSEVEQGGLNLEWISPELKAIVDPLWPHRRNPYATFPQPQPPTQSQFRFRPPPLALLPASPTVTNNQLPRPTATSLGSESGSESGSQSGASPSLPPAPALPTVTVTIPHPPLAPALPTPQPQPRTRISASPSPQPQPQLQPQPKTRPLAPLPTATNPPGPPPPPPPRLTFGQFPRPPRPNPIIRPTSKRPLPRSNILFFQPTYIYRNLFGPKGGPAGGGTGGDSPPITPSSSGSSMPEPEGDDDRLDTERRRAVVAFLRALARMVFSFVRYQVPAEPSGLAAVGAGVSERAMRMLAVHGQEVEDRFVERVVAGLVWHDGVVVLPPEVEALVEHTARERERVRREVGWGVRLRVDDVAYMRGFDAVGMMQKMLGYEYGELVVALVVEAGIVEVGDEAELRNVVDYFTKVIGEWTWWLFPRLVGGVGEFVF